MSASTGPVVAAGLITVFNRTIVQGHAMDNNLIPVVIGTTIAAGGLSIMENFLPGTAVAFSWLILAAVLLVRVDPTIPSPAESFATWYEGNSRRGGSGTF